MDYQSIIKQAGKPLNQTNLVDLLKEHNSVVAVVKVGTPGSEQSFEIESEWAVCVDVVKQPGWQYISILEDASPYRLGGLATMGIVELSAPEYTTRMVWVNDGNGSGRQVREPHTSIDQSFRAGPKYEDARVVGVQKRSRNPLVWLGLKKPDYEPI